MRECLTYEGGDRPEGPAINSRDRKVVGRASLKTLGPKGRQFLPLLPALQASYFYLHSGRDLTVGPIH